MNEKEILFELIQEINICKRDLQCDLQTIENDISRLEETSISEISNVDLRLLLFLRDNRECISAFLSDIENLENIYKDKVCISLETK